VLAKVRGLNDVPALVEVVIPEGSRPAAEAAGGRSTAFAAQVRPDAAAAQRPK